MITKPHCSFLLEFQQSTVYNNATIPAMLVQQRQDLLHTYHLKDEKNNRNTLFGAKSPL